MTEQHTPLPFEARPPRERDFRECSIDVNNPGLCSAGNCRRCDDWRNGFNAARNALPELVKALEDNQQLLETIYRLNTHGSVGEHDWEEGGAGDMIKKRISNNRAAIAKVRP